MTMTATGEREMRESGKARVRTASVQGLLLWLVLAMAPLGAGVADKSIFLVDGDGGVTAVNTETGQFFDLPFSAGEKLEYRLTGNGVAVLVTSQRFAGIGALPSGWASVRRSAGERFIRAEAQDYSALVVTSDRILSFSGRTGSWSEAGR